MPPAFQTHFIRFFLFSILFRELCDNLIVNAFLWPSFKIIIFIRSTQNNCSVFTLCKQQFFTFKIVDNVDNSVHNFFFYIFRHIFRVDKFIHRSVDYQQSGVFFVQNYVLFFISFLNSKFIVYI